MPAGALCRQVDFTHACATRTMSYLSSIFSPLLFTCLDPHPHLDIAVTTDPSWDSSQQKQRYNVLSTRDALARSVLMWGKATRSTTSATADRLAACATLHTLGYTLRNLDFLPTQNRTICTPNHKPMSTRRRQRYTNAQALAALDLRSPDARSKHGTVHEHKGSRIFKDDSLPRTCASARRWRCSSSVHWCNGVDQPGNHLIAQARFGGSLVYSTKMHLHKPMGEVWSRNTHTHTHTHTSSAKPPLTTCLTLPPHAFPLSDNASCERGALAVPSL